MKVIINDNQKGLFFQNGVLKRLLSAGKYSAGGSKSIETLSISDEIAAEGASLQKITELPEAKSEISEITVKNGEVCLHYVDGVFEDVLTAGRHAFWNDAGAHDFKVYDTSDPKITDVPETILKSLSAASNGAVKGYFIADGFKAIVYYNGTPKEYLGAGHYYYWNGGVSVDIRNFDMRVRELSVNGQEILTRDKVGVRVNFVMEWKITDYKAIAEDYPDISQSLYTAAQLVLRDYLGSKTVDELLAERERFGAEILELMKARTSGMHVEVLSAGVRDVILPGEISAIMNSVLAAEKRAQANVITRREEVASTRSLLNTAKLMDENATLRRLKELEYIEKICENVGEITVDARSSILTQLAAIVGNKDE